MSVDINYGRPAFPFTAFEEAGMDLRDYFAAKAMQALLAREYSDVNAIKDACLKSYYVADAMLKAREDEYLKLRREA